MKYLAIMTMISIIIGIFLAVVFLPFIIFEPLYIVGLILSLISLYLAFKVDIKKRSKIIYIVVNTILIFLYFYFDLLLYPVIPAILVIYLLVDKYEYKFNFS